MIDKKIVSLLLPYCNNPESLYCPAGQLPCENQTTCCDVICEDGYHPGGEDSTDCLLDTTNHDIYWEIDTITFGDIWDATEISTGVYYIRLETNHFTQTQEVTLLK